MLASVITVGAVVEVVSEHPETKDATIATHAARRSAEQKRLRFTISIVAPKPRPECDRTMAQA
jgi:hypothetical protein